MSYPNCSEPKEQGTPGLLLFRYMHNSVFSPGFRKDIPPLKEERIEDYAAYVKREIKKLGLKRYWLGGISFGFLVANAVNVGKECKGILAMEPFLNSKILRMSRFVRFYLNSILNTISFFNLENFLWKSKFFKSLLLDRKHPKRYIDLTLREINPKTFFGTAKIILNRKDSPKLKNIPYVLLINKKDGSMDSAQVLDYFEKNATKLLIESQTVEHYPATITKEYFESRIKKDKILNVIQFMNSIK